MLIVASVSAAPLKDEDVAYEGLDDLLAAVGGPEGVMKIVTGLMGALGGGGR